MHPSLEELLDLRDGAGSEAAARHAAACPECAKKLADLGEMRALLSALPTPEPSRDLWPALREAALTRRRRRWMGGIAAAAAVLLCAAGLLLVTGRLLRRGTNESGPVGAGVAPSGQAGEASVVPKAPASAVPAPATPAPPSPQMASAAPALQGREAEIGRLIRRSQSLESLLRHVEAKPRVQSGWQAAAVTELQDHLASLDGRIAVAETGGDSRQVVGLWQKRVDLLGTLVQVQSQEKGEVRL